jgi:4-hydroxy-tetrahydrodipicolinate reductase
MTVRLAIVGACGRMGKRLVTLAGEDDDLQVVAQVDRDTDALSDVVSQTMDGVIDFSVREQVSATVNYCQEAGLPLVLGTTGLTPQDKAMLGGLAQRVPVVFAPNFSVGVNCIFALVGEAAQLLGDQYDIEVVEAHHRRKVDAPSGTAVRLGEILAESRGWDYLEVVKAGRDGMVGARPDMEIGMSVVRGGDVVGEHTVTYFGAGEQVSITHRATNRDVFVLGALRAARWACAPNRQPGLYSMGDVLRG